jgi:hypothetical protein
VRFQCCPLSHQLFRRQRLNLQCINYPSWSEHFPVNVYASDHQPASKLLPTIFSSILAKIMLRLYSSTPSSRAPQAEPSNFTSASTVRYSPPSTYAQLMPNIPPSSMLHKSHHMQRAISHRSHILCTCWIRTLAQRVLSCCKADAQLTQAIVTAAAAPPVQPAAAIVIAAAA